MKAIDQKFETLCVKCGTKRLISYRGKWSIENGFSSGFCKICNGKKNGFKKGNYSGLRFGEGQKGHIVPHTEESKIKIRLNTPIRRGNKNNFWKDGSSKAKDYGSYLQHKRRAREVNANGSHTYQEWEELRRRFNFTCPCCKLQEPFTNQKYQFLTEDHIVPLTKCGANDITNIQPLCKSCNCKKHIKIINYELEDIFENNPIYQNI